MSRPRLDRVPVVDLELHITTPESDVLKLLRQPLLLRSERFDLLASSRWPQPTVSDIRTHIAHRHAGGRQTSDPHDLIEVVLVVDPVLAALAPTNGCDDSNRLVVAERAGREASQRCCFLDRVRVAGGVCSHSLHHSDFKYFELNVFLG